MQITGSTNVRTVTISDAGVRAVLSGTHLAPVADSVIAYARQYNIDPNFFLGYVLEENNFMDGYQADVPVWWGNNNPYDIVCANAPCNEGNCPHVENLACGDPSGNAFATGCANPTNGWCYARYPSLATGVQAAFWQTNYWITPDGFAPTWSSLLQVAGFGPGNIGPITTAATGWSNQYPPGSGGGGDGGCPPDYYPDGQGGCVLAIQPGGSTSTAALAGLGLLVLAGAAYELGRSL